MQTVIEQRDAIEYFSANMSFAMRERGLSVRALAAEIGEPITTVHRIASGDNEAKISLASRVSEFFGIPMDDFLRKPAEFKKIFHRRNAG